MVVQCGVIISAIIWSIKFILRWSFFRRWSWLPVCDDSLHFFHFRWMLLLAKGVCGCRIFMYHHGVRKSIAHRSFSSLQLMIVSICIAWCNCWSFSPFSFTYYCHICDISWIIVNLIWCHIEWGTIMYPQPLFNWGLLSSDSCLEIHDK